MAELVLLLGFALVKITIATAIVLVGLRSRELPDDTGEGGLDPAPDPPPRPRAARRPRRRPTRAGRGRPRAHPGARVARGG